MQLVIYDQKPLSSKKNSYKDCVQHSHFQLVRVGEWESGCYSTGSYTIKVTWLFIFLKIGNVTKTSKDETKIK